MDLVRIKVTSEEADELLEMTCSFLWNITGWWKRSPLKDSNLKFMGFFCCFI
jgi:hypothetical protein